MSLFVLLLCYLITVTFWYTLKSGSIMSPGCSFLFLKIALAVQVILSFHMNFRIISPSSVGRDGFPQTKSGCSGRKKGRGGWGTQSKCLLQRVRNGPDGGKECGIRIY